MKAVIFSFKTTIGTEIMHFIQEDAIKFQFSCKADIIKFKGLCMNRNITAGKNKVYSWLSIISSSPHGLREK